MSATLFQKKKDAC